MITITSTEAVPLQFDMRVAGVAAYLDNFALIELAKPYKLDRRTRFLSAFQTLNGSLLFSGTNAAELSALKDGSAANVRAFLNSFGPRWAFVRLDPGEIIRREAAGDANACLFPELMDAYFQDRKAEMSPSDTLLDMSADTFLRLGALMDWMAPHRERMVEDIRMMDTTIIKTINGLRVAHEKDPGVLDATLPPIPFNPTRPATFVWNHLIRGLVMDAKGHPPKAGDGMDLLHAVVGAAYGSFATLDKHWKARVESLPKPNAVAKIYYAPELDQLVDELEAKAHEISAR